MNTLLMSLWVKAQSFMGSLRERAREEGGATAVEYGMIVALIAAVIVTVVTTLGTKIDDAFSKIANALP